MSVDSLYFEEEAVINKSVSDDVTNKQHYNELNIIEEKLQELYDVNYEILKNPNFEKFHNKSNPIIEKELLNYLGEKIIISNLKPIVNLHAQNDSVQTIVFEYKINSDKIIKTDTIRAFIITKNIVLDHQVIKSIKVKFSEVAN